MARVAVRKGQKVESVRQQGARRLWQASRLKLDQRDAPQHQGRVPAWLTGLCQEHNDPPGWIGRPSDAMQMRCR